MLGRPLFSEHDVVVRRAPERMGISFVGAGVPKLEIADGHVPAQVIHITWRNRSFVRGMNETPLVRLRLGKKPGVQRVEGLAFNHVHPVHAIQTRAVQVGMVEEHPAEVIRQGNVGVQVQTPPPVLAAGEAGIQRGTLVELPSVLVKKIGLNADRAVFAGHGVSRFSRYGAALCNAPIFGASLRNLSQAQGAPDLLTQSNMSQWPLRRLISIPSVFPPATMPKHSSKMGALRSA